MEMREKAIDAAIAAAPSYWHCGEAQKDLERRLFGAVVDAVLDALREPTPEMLRIAVTMTDLTDAHWDKAAVVLEGMPHLPALQQEGLRAVADMYRDWQAMIDSARTPRKEAVEYPPPGFHVPDDGGVADGGKA